MIYEQCLCQSDCTGLQKTPIPNQTNHNGQIVQFVLQFITEHAIFITIEDSIYNIYCNPHDALQSRLQSRSYIATHIAICNTDCNTSKGNTDCNKVLIFQSAMQSVDCNNIALTIQLAHALSTSNR